MPPKHQWIIKFILITLLGFTLSLNPGPVHGQEGIVVEAPAAGVDFGKSITFTARISAANPVQEAYVLFRGVTETVERVEKMQPTQDGTFTFTYDASLNIFPPFSWIVYWFQATLTDGQTYTSEPLQVQYRDDRFPWQHLSQANITINWYAGDEAFGQAALGSAGAGLISMKDLIPISLTDPIDIYIYSNIDDLQGTLLLGGQTWAGGHAHAELGVVLVAIPPGVSQYTEMDTKIPHELAHIMLYRVLGENYAKQPAWLVEGISSMAEIYPNPDYAHALEIASTNDTLLPFESLCASFPADSGSAFLAYAQSQSFVTYIRDSFGTPGLTRLMNIYNEDYGCDLGVAQALSVTLGQLDQRWRETVLGQNVGKVAFRNLLPFLLLIALVLLVPLWGAIDVMRKRRKRENGKPVR